SLRRLGERQLAVDADGQAAVAQPAEDVARAGEELLARRRVVRERGARQEERAFPAQELRVERAHRAARLAEERHRAARGQRVEPLLEGGAADRVVDDLDALAAGEAPDL